MQVSASAKWSKTRKGRAERVTAMFYPVSYVEPMESHRVVSLHLSQSAMDGARRNAMFDIQLTMQQARELSKRLATFCDDAQREASDAAYAEWEARQDQNAQQ